MSAWDFFLACGSAVGLLLCVTFLGGALAHVLYYLAAAGWGQF